MRYKLSLVRRDGQREIMSEPIEARGIGRAVDIVVDMEEYQASFGAIKGTQIKIADDRKSATITNRLGRLEITEIPTRKFRVDTTDMPSSSRGNPIMDCDEESIDHIISTTVMAALQAGFLYNQITIKKSDDGRVATMHEFMHGSMMKITELNKYMVDLYDNGKRQAGVGPFWGLTVQEVISILGEDDPALQTTEIWWDVEDDNAVLRHAKDAFGTKITITRER